MTQIPTGYQPWNMDTPDPYEDAVGPFYVRELEDGTWASAFYARADHLNMAGAVHGGMLMTFADQASFAVSRNSWDGPGKPDCVTVAMNSEFISAAVEGDLLEATGHITRETRSMIFVRGTITSGGKTILTFSSILKKLGG